MTGRPDSVAWIAGDTAAARPCLSDGIEHCSRPKAAFSLNKIWHLLTGEYPPLPGGVSEYTENLAAGLAEAECEVHVWTAGCESEPQTGPANVIVHRVAGSFRPRDLRRLSDALDRFPGPRTILVQYVPHAFGSKAMNLPLAAWVRSRGRDFRDDIRVMFHEVAFPFVRWPAHHNLIAMINRLMTRLILAGCRQTYVSTPAWNDILDRWGGRYIPRTWLPVPTNIPPASPAERAPIRDRMTAGDPSAIVIGHFGTFGGPVRALITSVFPKLLTARSQIQAAFVGRGANGFRDELIARHPDTKDRVHAADGLPAEQVAAWLQSCDVAVQPFPDGISTRRTSAMAFLANGVPVVTNAGDLSESLWAEENFVALAAKPDAELLAIQALRLVDDPIVRRDLARRGRLVYDSRFSLACTIAELMRDPPAVVTGSR